VLPLQNECDGQQQQHQACLQFYCAPYFTRLNFFDGASGRRGRQAEIGEESGASAAAGPYNVIMFSQPVVTRSMVVAGVKNIAIDIS
jgi:hypothetical protein